MLRDFEGSGFGVEGCWLRLALGVSGLDVWLSQNMCFFGTIPVISSMLLLGYFFALGT